MTSPDSAPASRSSDKPAVLLVDDEAVNLQVLSAALDGMDYKLICAINPIEALRLAQERKPHLVLLDVMMPGMDGFEVCRRLRADEQTRGASIIFLSSLHDPRDRIQGIELGAVDFITKPFNTAEVRARVRRQVELQDERRQLLTPVVTAEQRLAQIVAEGENERTEFKSTLRWSVNDNRPEHGVEVAWLKTVAAFLNTSGGRLVVGVDDSGQALGTELDAFENDDKYLLHVNNRLKQHIGVEHVGGVRFGLFPFKGKQVLLIECSPSSKPVFMVDGSQEYFYIRTGPGTRKLSMSQMLAYVTERANKSPAP
jgi:DNA-binding response OmpR family regulator